MQRQSEHERTEILVFENNAVCQALFGAQNGNLKIITRELHVRMDNRGGEVTLCGEPERLQLALNLIGQLYDLVDNGFPLQSRDINHAIRILRKNPETRLASIFQSKVDIVSGGAGKIIGPKSPAQKAYMDCIRENDLVFSIGPAGTGKTYLAMAMAVYGLLQKAYKRIILTRPAVEAGEKLGFLPGDIAEKVNPYLRPLYDALYDMVDLEKAQNWIQQGTVEVAPLAFMRGRTLNDSFVILDEAQNTTQEQMKMFLTRLGYGSKAVVTGDVTQIDLPDHQKSGMIHAGRILQGIEGIEVCRFTHADVVRHPLVRRIIRAYDREEHLRDVEKEPN